VFGNVRSSSWSSSSILEECRDDIHLLCQHLCGYGEELPEGASQNQGLEQGTSLLQAADISGGGAPETCGTGDSPCPTAKEGVSSDDVSRDVGAHESGPGIHGTRFDKNLVHSCGTFSTLDCLFELAMPRCGLIQDLSWMWNAPFCQ
jgi:hypothetical protein